MKAESATKKPTPAVSSTKGAGPGSSSTSSGGSKTVSFCWKVCANLIARDRVDIKQQAVLDGLRLGEKLTSILRNHINSKNHGLGDEDLADWAEQFDKVKEMYEIPHSTIGFIGAIGSGKSTLINALLGERDLLPSSNDRAGTAAACKVAYHHGSGSYRATVLYRSRQSFTDELDKLFQNLRAKRELQMMTNDPAADQQEIEDQLGDIDASTSETLEILECLLGVKGEDLNITSTEEFLKAYPLEVLGTTEEITETDREIFLKKTKPYTDSTPGIYKGQKLMLWPLIEHVTIFVKSDILKYGLELVDLPGLGDAVESRSRVAERFSQYLDITAIVAPAIRVTEEKTVTGFIKRRQEDEMRMNGKFDKNSLCVVVSKNEDMDLDSHISDRCKAYPHLRAHLARLKDLGISIRKADSGLDGSEHETLGRNTTAAASNQGDVEANRREFATLRESLKQAAVSTRNRGAFECIQKGFRMRQSATKPSRADHFYTDTVEVFPTSARAFQEIRHPGGVKEVGFPTERHTGIPRFKQWLFEVTLEKREKHLDAILNQLLSLFVRIQTWISMKEDATVTPTTGLHDIDFIHERHRRSLTALLRQSGEQLRRIEPLKAKEVAIAACQKEFPGQIDRWRYRYPDRTNTFIKLFGSIQTCILRKNGDYHHSKGKYPYEYQWVDGLAAVFIDKIVDDWKHTFIEVVPSYETKIQESLEHVWQRYMMALNNFCGEHNAAHLKVSGKVQQAIENAEAHLGYAAHMTLKRFRAGAQIVHPLFRHKIQKILTPVFEEAYSIKGAGCVRKREELLKQFATNRSANMPVRACKVMEAALAELIQRHVNELEGLADDAVSTVEKQMKLLLGISNAPSNPTARASQKLLVAEISPHLASWKICWQKPSSQREDHVMRGDLSIPEPELLKFKDDKGGVQAAASGVVDDVVMLAHVT